MKIAVIGSGISGMTAAYLLSQEHEVHVIERASRLGGHTATVDVEWQGEKQAIDTGFIVFNDRTYPHFIQLLKRLGVKSQASSMGFSVSENQGAFEYAGNSLSTLFAQKTNIFSFAFWRMLRDIVRFNKEAENDLNLGRIDNETTLGEYLTKKGYSDAFQTRYLIPMGAAIWSASYEQMLQFPLFFFVKFFRNHGLLSITNKPTWHVISGGSKSYIPALTEPYRDNIKTGMTIESVIRLSDSVEIKYEQHESEYYDHVVLATHSDEALALLKDPSMHERELLGKIRYQENSVVLHTDTSLLPVREKIWSAWNYRMSENYQELPVLTYDMNILQGLKSAHTFCVTLNADHLIDESKIIGRFYYAHPQFDIPAMDAQKKKTLISGVNRTSYCGAYWANGFHEDGVNSAIDVAKDLGIDVKKILGE